MKKISILVALFCVLMPGTSRAIEPISMTLAGTIALPLAKAAWNALMAETEAKGCRPECFQGGSYCKSGLRYRNYRECKGACQRIVKHGDYQLRVRFYKDEQGGVQSLLNCAEVGAIASGRDKLGKEKPSRSVALSKSIAIYSPDDLDHILYYVLKHKVAKILSVSNQDFLLKEFASQIDTMKKEGNLTMSSEELVKKAKDDAKDTMRLIELQIEDLRRADLFGPQ